LVYMMVTEDAPAIFVGEDVMDGLDPALMAKMPLAEAVLLVWRHVADERWLQELFECHRGRSYERVISFPTLVQLVADALMQHEGSGNQSFSRGRESGLLDASPRAVYGKLGRLPVALSMALFSGMTDRLRDLLPVAGPTSAGGLADFHVVILDGKTVKRVPLRLKPLRMVTGGVTGGKALVALERSTGLVVAMTADPNGDANDIRLVPELLPEVRRKFSGPRLWLADRQFCDLQQMTRFAEDEDAFVLRYNAKLKFEPDPEAPARQGVDGRGRAFTEEFGMLGRQGHKQRRHVRRITLHRTEGEIAVVTNLSDAEKHPGTTLLDLYLERWGIERVFQQVTEVFGLEHLIGGTPEATIFQFAFCLVLYDQIQLIRASLARHRQEAGEKISTEQLFVDVRREMIAWAVVLTPEATSTWIPPRPPDEVRRRLDELLSRLWSKRWIKATNKNRRPHQSRPPTRTHISVLRALKADGRR
jgi:hypothetical protein